MKKNSLTIRDRLRNIVEKWYILEPLFFSIWNTHEMNVNTTIKTIRTAHGKIEYNPEFINTLSDSVLQEVIKVEVIRILLKHPYSRKREIPSLSYLASNITIQEYTETQLELPKAEDVFGTEKYNFKHFEFYYFKLVELSLKQSGSGGKSVKKDHVTHNNANDNTNSSPNLRTDEDNDKSTLNDNKEIREDTEQLNNNEQSQDTEQNKNETHAHIEFYLDESKSGTENAEEWDFDELIQHVINDKVEIAQQNKLWGSVQGSLQETIIASLTPKVDYRSILKAFRASVLSQRRWLTRMKPSRRYEFQYMGSRREFNTKLLVAIDVSGSMDKQAITYGYSVINHFFKYGIEQVDVIQFDSIIQGELMSLKKAQKSIQIIGRGGTNFQPILNYIESNDQYDGLIIFTDGYSSIPQLKKATKTQILWLFNNEENYNYSKKSLSKIGKCAFLID